MKRQEKVQRHEANAVMHLKRALDSLEIHDYPQADRSAKLAVSSINLANAEQKRIR